jgi:hypothetical protein
MYVNPLAIAAYMPVGLEELHYCTNLGKDRQTLKYYLESLKQQQIALRVVFSLQ